MSFASLSFPATYALQGAYRLSHDPSLWAPMWHTVRPAARRALLVALAWAVLSWPVQLAVVRFFMKGSARVLGLRGWYDAFVGGPASSSASSSSPSSSSSSVLPLPSLTTFATFVMILNQCQTIIEFLLRRQLALFRARAYQVTVDSSKYSEEWWGPYVEEWQEPPYQLARALFASKKPFYRRWASSLVQRILLYGTPSTILSLSLLLLPLAACRVPPLDLDPNPYTHFYRPIDE